jgi:DNA-binding beta-propeller fold protein YncE
MIRIIRSVALLGFALLCVPSGWSAPILQETARIALPEVKGRIDHLTADLDGKRLFVAALGNGSVEVIDVEAGRTLQSLKGFGEPQGLLFLATTARLFVTDARADHVTLIVGSKLQPSGTIKVPDDGDNVRYDSTGGKVWVGAGSGRSSALLSIDPAVSKIDRQIGLRGHPESFQIEQRGQRIFVNVPTAHLVQVVDRQHGLVATDWNVPAAANFPMALDEDSQRLFVGTRTPARLIVYDTGSGKPVATMQTVGDADDIFYDAAARRVYISGGEGSVQVFQQDSADSYRLVDTVPTRSGARTSLFVPKWRKLFVAVPRRGQEAAEIRVFSVAP